MKKIMIFGVSGAIGRAWADCYAAQPSVEIHACARQSISLPASMHLHINTLQHESDVITLAESFEAKTFDRLIIATGLLHHTHLNPEKSMTAINTAAMDEVFWVNTYLPSLILKHFLPKIKTDATCAVLSARVGSISDNRLGGWYAYRASKAALNMMIRSLSIEWQRMHPHACIVGLHPGTVDSGLSKPFQSRLKPDQLFTPQQSVEYMHQVLESLMPSQSDRIWAYDGQEIPP